MRMCRRDIGPAAIEDVFVLTYDRMRRFNGAWHVEKAEAFPECVFLEIKRPQLFMEEIKKRQDIIQNLVIGVPILLPKEEEQFLKDIFGDSRHLAMSKGYIAAGKTYVTEGPLRGKEMLIQKIDRHRRMAKLPVPKARQLREIRLGLEIVEKQ